MKWNIAYFEQDDTNQPAEIFEDIEARLPVSFLVLIENVLSCFTAMLNVLVNRRQQMI
jgi:hypothetical protein